MIVIKNQIKAYINNPIYINILNQDCIRMNRIIIAQLLELKIAINSKVKQKRIEQFLEKIKLNENKIDFK